MIASVVSCPNPPLLLPGRTGQPVTEVEVLRSACTAAISRSFEAVDRIVVVGGSRVYDGTSLSVAVAETLLETAGVTAPIENVLVQEAYPVADCVTLGRLLAARVTDRSVGLLVMADGSARRTVKAPGYLDERAAGFDAMIEAALASGDPAGLAALDAGLAAELLVAGRAPWQVLAGAVEGRRFASRGFYSDDPFGVWYPVVSWSAQ